HRHTFSYSSRAILVAGDSHRLDAQPTGPDVARNRGSRGLLAECGGPVLRTLCVALRRNSCEGGAPDRAGGCLSEPQAFTIPNEPHGRAKRSPGWNHFLDGSSGASLYLAPDPGEVSVGPKRSSKRYPIVCHLQGFPASSLVHISNSRADCTQDSCRADCRHQE